MSNGGKFSASIFVIVFVSMLFGCQPQNPDILRFGLATAPISLDPRYATDATSTRINRLIYQQLVKFDETFQAVPACANWSVVSPRQYRFYLLPKCHQFHNGNLLTAEDVKSTYDFVLDIKNASPYRSRLLLINRIEVIDNKVLDVYLNKIDPLFPGYMDIGILPKAKIQQQHPFETRPIGSGAFRFSHWSDTGQLGLIRISDNMLLEFIPVPQPTVRVLKLLRGEIDIIQNDLSPELVSYMRAQPNIRVKQMKGTNFSYIGFNMNDELVGNHRVRLAIAHAIDKNAIIKYLYNGAARPATSIFPSEHWVGNDALKPIAFDPELSRSIVASLGYGPANPMVVSYKTSSDPFRIRLATIIQSQLKFVGIKLIIKSYDWGTFFGDIKAGRFQMYSLAWVGIKTPDIYYYVFHSNSVPPYGANRGGFSDPEIDLLLDQAVNTLDRSEQIASYRKVQALLLQSLPYVPLWYEDHILIHNDTISGYEMRLDGNYDGLMQVKKLNHRPNPDE